MCGYVCVCLCVCVRVCVCVCVFEGKETSRWERLLGAARDSLQVLADDLEEHEHKC